jgi:hypothetical protein
MRWQAERTRRERSDRKLGGRSMTAFGAMQKPDVIPCQPVAR